MRVAAVLLATCLLSVCAGCESVGRQGQTSAGADRSTKTTGAPAPSAARAASDDESIGVGVPADNPGIEHADEDGRTPDEVLAALVDARNRRQWRAAYALYADPDGSFREFVLEAEEVNERYEDFVVHEVRVPSPDIAVVRVTYRAWMTPPSAAPREVDATALGQWWSLQKIDGHWRVNWRPVQ